MRRPPSRKSPRKKKLLKSLRKQRPSRSPRKKKPSRNDGRSSNRDRFLFIIIGLKAMSGRSINVGEKSTSIS